LHQSKGEDNEFFKDRLEINEEFRPEIAGWEEAAESAGYPRITA
jgi:hypothetical protein